MLVVRCALRARRLLRGGFGCCRRTLTALSLDGNDLKSFRPLKIPGGINLQTTVCFGIKSTNVEKDVIEKKFSDEIGEVKKDGAQFMNLDRRKATGGSFNAHSRETKHDPLCPRGRGMPLVGCR